jgi:hypothetical protein
MVITVGVFRLLVGAPRADARQPGVHKGGAVYKCPALQPGGCQIIPFDKGGTVPSYIYHGEEGGGVLGNIVQNSGTFYISIP